MLGVRAIGKGKGCRKSRATSVYGLRASWVYGLKIYSSLSRTGASQDLRFRGKEPASTSREHFEAWAHYAGELALKTPKHGPGSLNENARPTNIRALIITYTLLGVPYYNYSIMGPKTLF